MSAAAIPGNADHDFKVKPLTGSALLLAAFAIAMGNFLVVLDTTIANVSIPTISGSLGVSTSQGTWVITSYAVAEAITVPLTGWLAKRFGAARVFIACYLAFAVVSLFCGLAGSLGALIGGRVALGLVGGPIMPLSQMLLLRIFPPQQATLSTVIWAMTTLIGPIVGPVLGGWICESTSWHWIFLINVPVAALGGMAVIFMLRGQPDPKQAASIDRIGLFLLILWVGSFQIMLDEGRNLDWFSSVEIRVLAVVAAAGFAAFMIWVLNHDDPIVDLKIFRHRGFAASVVTLAISFGAFFASVLILPLWLQQNMGYTATWAGYATGIMGLLAIVSSPLVGKAVDKFDPRLVVSIGIAGMGMIMLWRQTFTLEHTFLQIALPTLLFGPFLVMLIVPVTGIVMASVPREDQANAAGLSNFMRTVAGAFAAAIVQTGWANAARENQTELTGAMTQQQAAIDQMTASGLSPQTALATLNGLVERQSMMLATLDMFHAIAVCFFVAASLIWLAPKPAGPIDVSAGH
jgi:DHA2 family multidrug resistance protein